MLTATGAAVQEDSCGGKTHGSIWEQYARMRDALNASTAKTGRPIYYSITGIVPYNDAQPNMHCIRTNPKTGGGFSPRQRIFILLLCASLFH